jgi:hypothetical protein
VLLFCEMMFGSLYETLAMEWNLFLMAGKRDGRKAPWSALHAVYCAFAILALYAAWRHTRSLRDD